MNRVLLVLNVVLLVCAVVLWRLDASLEARREARRAADSAFHPLAGPATLAVADVKRLELVLPGAGAGTRWTYVRRDDGWHLPQHRDGFALGQEIEGFLKALLESHGTVVGRVPGDAEHFGLAPGNTIEAELFDGSDTLRLHALCGRVAPGQRSTESFLAAAGRETILHMRSNPRSYIQWSPESPLPPLLDTRVIPLALGRGLPAKISFGGAGAPAVREMIRREIPLERRLAMGPDRGPTFEWFGITAEGEKRINDDVSFAYASSLSSLVFDELLGPRSALDLALRSAIDSALETSSLTIALEYDAGASDTLRLGPRADGGLHSLHHSTTDQVFLVSEEKSRALVPDAKALLELPPPRAGPQQAPPAGPPLPPQPEAGEK